MTTNYDLNRATRGRAVAIPGHLCTPGRWRIDAATSTLQISVKVGFLATVSGRFTEVSGELELVANGLDSRITVEVQTSSLTSGSSHWDSVLMNAGLVDSRRNPTIAFESTGIVSRSDSWLLTGLLITERGCLEVGFELQVVQAGAPDRIGFRATGSIASKDAVRLLSTPGVDRLIGKSMGIDLMIEAVRV